MLKYLDKIKLMSETASNGQEALDMVLSKEPGYYSLIIVSRWCIPVQSDEDEANPFIPV